MRLRFWFSRGLQVLASILGASVLYGLLMWIQMDDSRLEFLLMMLPLYFILFGGFILLIMTFSLYKMMLSLCLSFGSTRREALVGMHIYRLIPTLGITALAALLYVFPGVEPLFSVRTMVLLSLGAFLLMGAVGSVLGMIYYRFGKVGAIITGISSVILGIGAGFLFAFSTNIQSGLSGLAGSLPLSWVPLVLGAAVYLLTMIPENLVIRNYQVKQ